MHLRAYLNSNRGFEKFYNQNCKFSKKKKKFWKRAEWMVCTVSQRPNGESPKYPYIMCYEI